jgi:two-component sensor histidine kinase
VTAFVGVLTTMSLLALAGTIFVAVRRRTRGSLVGAAILLASAWWMATYAAELASPDVGTKFLFDRLQFMGIAFIPLGWLLYVLLVTGRGAWVTPWRAVAAAVIPAVCVALAMTADRHGLIWVTYVPYLKGALPPSRSVWGPGLWGFVIYSYALIIAGIVILVRTLVRSRSLYGWQGSALLTAVMSAFLAHFVTDFLGLNPLPDLEMTPFVLCITLPIVAFLFLKLRRSDLTAVARGTIFDQMLDPVIILDEHNRVIDLNRPAVALMPAGSGKVLGETLEEASPEWGPMLLSAQDNSRVRVPDRAVYGLRRSPLADHRGTAVGSILVLHDLTETVAHEKRLAAAIAEKEVLLREVHHRVKNNLQIVSSLLSLQSRTIADPAIAAHFGDCQARINALALVHEALYYSCDAARLPFRQYLRDTAQVLESSYGTRARVTVDADEVLLDPDLAVPLGLIVAELISNAFKHAFPGPDADERVTVTLRLDSGTMILSVADNGKGLPSQVEIEHATTLGLQLVGNLSRQAGATIRVARSAGTCVTVERPISEGNSHTWPAY